MITTSRTDGFYLLQKHPIGLYALSQLFDLLLELNREVNSKAEKDGVCLKNSGGCSGCLQKLPSTQS